METINADIVELISSGSDNADLAHSLAECINEGRKLNAFKGTQDEVWHLIHDAISFLEEAKVALE